MRYCVRKRERCFKFVGRRAARVQTLSEMAGVDGLEKYRGEFEKLYNTLRSVHDNERKLTKKCRQLNAEIADQVARVSGVLGMTQEEQLANAGIRQVD